MLVNQAIDVPEIRNNRLMSVAQSYWPGIVISNAYIWFKLRAAEKEIERRLRVFVSQKEIVPMGTSQEDIDALVLAGDEVVEEPGYDYTPQLFSGEAWGLIETRQSPIVKIYSINFAYPAPTSTLYVIPDNWIRADKKYGRISLVPVQSSVSLPLNAFIMSSLGGGRAVPLMLQVRYRAGLTAARDEWPDVIDCIYKLAIMSIIQDQFLPQSGSVSADGLSQSISLDLDKHSDQLERRLEYLRQDIHGIRCMVMG